MSSGGRNVRKNFWLWGTWGKRVIRAPFLTQKVDDKIRNIVIGQTFIIALKEDGFLVSWGEDKLGCLGLGTDFTNCPEPKRVPFPTDFTGKVIDIQYGKHHVLALTNQGKVYAWGENQGGQLGANDTQTRYEPVFVEELRLETITQILAVENMSYALGNTGVVYAWGENKEGVLALEHDNPRVCKPESMTAMKETPVKKLEVKEGGGGGGGKGGKTIIAYVELADKLLPEDEVGGFKEPLGCPRSDGDGQEALAGLEGNEKDIFEGVDLMREVMDNTQTWWERMVTVRHGAPYEERTHADENNPGSANNAIGDRPGAEENCSALQLDRYVGLEILEKASYELDGLIHAAKSQFAEIRSQERRGTKNVKFMLSMFMDDCKLRREKIRRTVAARQLMDLKKAITDIEVVTDPHDTERLNHANEQLVRKLRDAQNIKVYDIFTQSLQESLIECIEFKLMLQHTQVDFSKAKKDAASTQPITAPLRIIKERWGALKRFSIYNLYQECNLRGQNVGYSSDQEMLEFLVQSSDGKIDQIINIDRDQMISRDTMVPPLCYDLLVENAELRKMCNTYQLKVLLMQDGKHAGGAIANR